MKKRASLVRIARLVLHIAGNTAKREMSALAAEGAGAITLHGDIDRSHDLHGLLRKKTAPFMAQFSFFISLSISLS